MKQKILLTIISLTIFSTIFAQNFGAIGTEWYYSEYTGGTSSYNTEYLHYESVADTIIQGKSTHKIVQTYFGYNDNSVVLEPIFVYEQNDTVFMYNFQKGRFLKLYIFNTIQDDTLTLDIPFPPLWPDDSTYRLVVDSVFTIVVDGVSLKKYETTPIDEYKCNYFMDRIGTLSYFFPLPTIMIPESDGRIRCFSDSQIDTSFLSITCDYRLISSIEEIDNNTKFINIYPNPFQSIFTISINSLLFDEAKVEVLDITGKLLKRINVEDNNSNIDLSGFAKGFYFVKVKIGDNIIIKKVVNQ